MSFHSEILKFTAADGYELCGKLSLPDSGVPKAVVVFVSGAGTNTYDNKFKAGSHEFCFYDLYESELTKRGIALFRFNTRGISRIEEEPFYEIDLDGYRTYTPEAQASDIAVMISSLKGMDCLSGAKVILLGYSEGGISASLAVEKEKAAVDALLFVGYINDNYLDLVQWQLSGQSMIIMLCSMLDRDGDGRISREEFTPYASSLKSMLGTDVFEDVDKNEDGYITADDLDSYYQVKRELIISTIMIGDEKWLWQNYQKVTLNYLYSHSVLEANYYRVQRILDIPIHIFHGEFDANQPVRGTRMLAGAFRAKGYDNLSVHIFKNHDADLNYSQYIVGGRLSEGISSLLDVISEIAES